MPLPPGFDFETLHPWLSLAALALFLFLLGKIFRRFMRRMIEGRYIGRDIAGLLLIAFKASAWMLLALLALQLTGVVHEAWAILSATIAALAVGFVANWSLLSNVTAGILVMIFRPFRVDDMISVWEGDVEIAKGEVIDLNLMFVSISTETLTVKRLPNNLLFQRTVEVHRPAGERASIVQDRLKPFFRQDEQD